MKIVALGDTHGRSIWKEIIDKETNVDKWVFIGDYFDTHGGGYSANRQIENFKDIIAFKKANPEQVVLLFGNHDFHYIKGANETYSGHQPAYAIDICEILEEALREGLMQMCYKNDKFLFSHAGLTKTWVTNSFNDEPDAELPTIENVEKSVNDLFKYKPYKFRFTMGQNFSGSGNDICQPPIWVRPESLIKDMFDGVTCVVGHTTVKELGLNSEYPNIILIDCLGTSQQYLVIENNIPRIEK
jgi:hypothetical protein